MSAKHSLASHPFFRRQIASVGKALALLAAVVGMLGVLDRAARAQCPPPHTFTGFTTGAWWHLGRSVVAAGDVDDDGFGDVIAGGWGLPPWGGPIAAGRGSIQGEIGS